MKQIEVVAAIIIYNEQILCMQRDKAKYDYISYKFEFPGGKIEDGETKTEALMRELREEMNMCVKVSDEDLFLTVHHTYPDFKITMHSYICHIESQEFIRKEHIEHKWVCVQGLKQLDWAGADIPIVQKLLELKKDELSR